MSYTITLSRDGLWPTVWRWAVRVDGHRFHGEAFTRSRAEAKATRAATTYVHRVVTEA